MAGALATPMDPVTAGTTVGITGGVGTIHTAGITDGITGGATAMIPTDMDTTPTAGTMVGAGTTVGTTILGPKQAEIALAQGQPAQQRPVLLLELTTATVDHQNILLLEVLE